MWNKIYNSNLKTGDYSWAYTSGKWNMRCNVWWPGSYLIFKVKIKNSGIFGRIYERGEYCKINYVYLIWKFCLRKHYKCRKTFRILFLEIGSLIIQHSFKILALETLSKKKKISHLGTMTILYNKIHLLILFRYYSMKYSTSA